MVVLVIPNVEFPLDPHTCTCQTLYSTASKVTIDIPPQAGSFSYSCTADQNCSSIFCDISQSRSNILFHPCHEVVIITVASTMPGNPANQVIFNQTETRPLTGGDVTITAEVTLISHNYSMDFKVGSGLSCHVLVFHVNISPHS